MNIEWVKTEVKYLCDTYDGKLGNYTIFKSFYDGAVSKDSKDKIALNCRLPGIKDRLGHYESTVDAHKYAESVLAHWLKSAGLMLEG